MGLQYFSVANDRLLAPRNGCGNLSTLLLRCDLIWTGKLGHVFNTGRVASMLSSACNRGSHSQEICKGCGTSFRRRGVTDEKTSRGGFRCGPSPASCQWVSRTEARGAGKGRGRDSKSTNAGQSPEPSRNERRCFNEVVKDLALVFLNQTVVAAPGQSHCCNRPPAKRIRVPGLLALRKVGVCAHFSWHAVRFIWLPDFARCSSLSEILPQVF